MKILSKLDSLDNVQDGSTRKLITKTTSSGSGNVVSSVSVSGDTITYTKGVTALTGHQNAFSNVKIGSSTIAADQAGDTLELVAGSNITLTPDTTNDKVTIAASQPTVNNGTLTIQKNGTNVQTFSANQSTNATANIIVPTKTSELINDNNFITAANDITGNAATATKLKNTKTISTTGDVVSSGTFDGSDNLVLSTRRRGASVGQSSNTTTNPWYKVASATISASYNDRWITFLVNGAYATFKTRMGILKAQFRINGSGLWEDGGLWWESVTNDINLDDFVLVYKNNESSVTVEIWCNVASSYNGYHFEVLGEGSRDGRSNRDWTLYTTWSAGSQSSLPDGYTTIVSTVSTLKNPVTKATQDGEGNIITSTYVKKSGDTMTGALNLVNGTPNKIGDDVSIGDFNKAGALGIMGQNGTTTLALIKNGSSWGVNAERAEIVYNSTDKCIEFNFV